MGLGRGILNNFGTVVIDGVDVVKNSTTGDGNTTVQRGGGVHDHGVNPQTIVKTGLETGSIVTLNTATDGAGAGGAYESSGASVATASIVTGNTSDNRAPSSAIPSCIG